MKAITYSFRFDDGRREQVALHFDDHMLMLDRAEGAWTEIASHRCDHCPLPNHGACPFASAMAPFIAPFDAYASFDEAEIEVITDRRTISARRAVQHGLASLLGLVGATSGCPHLAFFRPLARFHLPFASEEETLFRAFSSYMLGRNLGQGTGTAADIDFDGLGRNYHAAALVNRGMADRVRAWFHNDAVVNALAVLDTFAQAVPYVIEERLEELRYIFHEAPDGAEL